MIVSWRNSNRAERKRRFIGSLILLATGLLYFSSPSTVVEAGGARPAYTRDCSWRGCTVKLNNSETKRLASAGPALTVVGATCNGIGGPFLAAVCAGSAVPTLLWAQSATSQGKCLRIFVPWTSFATGLRYASEPCDSGGGAGAR